MSKEQWMYQLGDSDIWVGKSYETKEEAIKEGIKARESEDMFENLKLSIGQQESVGVSGIDIDLLLENVAENTIEELSEVGEGFLQDVTIEHQEELEQKLNDVFFEWINKHKYNPEFYRVVNIEEVKVEKEGTDNE